MPHSDHAGTWLAVALGAVRTGYEEMALYGAGEAGGVAFCSGTSDGKRTQAC